MEPIGTKAKEDQRDEQDLFRLVSAQSLESVVVATPHSASANVRWRPVKGRGGPLPPGTYPQAGRHLTRLHRLSL